MYRVRLDEAQEKLPDLIDAAIQGEEVLITRDDKPVIRLVPVVEPVKRRQFGSARGLISITDDFDEPLEDFEDYVR